MNYLSKRAISLILLVLLTMCADTKGILTERPGADHDPAENDSDVPTLLNDSAIHTWVTQCSVYGDLSDPVIASDDVDCERPSHDECPCAVARPATALSKYPGNRATGDAICKGRYEMDIDEENRMQMEADLPEGYEA